ncbi:helix-turn-helix transcriptional regulator [Sphingobium sp. HWE2-09]|uniref:helix-turn-helix transcriptional regulator n=1 Tax=Sphingobium sp. HWE2-09 TaxID=3108390 RepID=UPI002DD39044|nr:AlpA family phage regulatory protein [Sphingobium sp. HWE2-09]
MTTIFRRKQLEGKLKISRSTIYTMIAAGTFPKPIKIGKRAVGWPDDLIEQWLDDRRNGRTLLPTYQLPVAKQEPGQ